MACTRSRSRVPVVVLAATSLLVAGCSTLDSPGEGTTEAGAGSDDEPAPPEPTIELSTLADYESQQIDWGSCEDFDPPESATSDGFECGYLSVPLDYENLSAGSVSVAVNRRPARGESQGALVLNPGGPGGSGIDYAFFDTFVVSPDVVQEYDLVGFDPRGVARSEGIDCLSDERLDVYLAADVTPNDEEEEAEYRALLDELAAGCGEQPLAEFMDTQSVARDVDLLRTALGEDELNWLGKSYGTQIGAVYAQLFPATVGRMVLDGSVDPDLQQPGAETFLEQLTGFELALTAFVEDCLPRDDCPLTGELDDGVSQLTVFLARLDIAPLSTTDGERALTQGLATYGVIGPLYQRDAWDLLRDGLAEAFEDGTADTLVVLSDVYAERGPDGTYRGNLLEALPAVSCLDAAPQGEGRSVDPDEAQQRLEEAAPTLGQLFDLRFDACESWRFPAAGSPELTGEGAPPILVVGTTRDPATPYEWSVEMADTLESAVLLTFDGDGHTAYLTTGSECVDEIVDEFYLTGELPRDGTTCVAEYE